MVFLLQYADEETSDTNKIYNGLLPPRLMFAVGVPAFQNISESTDENSTETFTPALLGVASTDVPVQDIDKLSLPYLLGVNGYSFIVSNNGYVLHHPDLRAMVKGSPIYCFSLSFHPPLYDPFSSTLA